MKNGLRAKIGKSQTWPLEKVNLKTQKWSKSSFLGANPVLGEKGRGKGEKS